MQPLQDSGDRLLCLPQRKCLFGSGSWRAIIVSDTKAHACRLVEALEMYDNGAMESYMTEESLESQMLVGQKAPAHKRKVSRYYSLQMLTDNWL